MCFKCFGFALKNKDQFINKILKMLETSTAKASCDFESEKHVAKVKGVWKPSNK